MAAAKWQFGRFVKQNGLCILAGVVFWRAWLWRKWTSVILLDANGTEQIGLRYYGHLLVSIWAYFGKANRSSSSGVVQ